MTHPVAQRAPGSSERPQTPEERAAPGALVLAALLGVLASFAGTAMHRGGTGGVPWGLVLSAALVVALSVFVRAAFSRSAVVVFAVAAFVTNLVLTYAGPGGDVLVTGDAASMTWLVVTPVGAMAGWLLPGRFVRDDNGIETVPLDAASGGEQ